ncbi:MAG TPA: hypothetical protein VMU42_02675 [Candidatus Sulfotelmatobacter sp.]|nr:hypothetical protein [Candidatus Sulfotelmatobacter sp.]
MERDFRSKADYWLARAAEVHDMAQGFHDPAARAGLLAIAKGYEALAATLAKMEERQAAD